MSTLPPPGEPLVGPRRSVGSTARPSRRHPARRARATALALSIGSTAGLAGYLHHLDQEAQALEALGATAATTTATAAITNATAATTNTDVATTAATTTPATTAADASTETTAGATTTGLVDGTYTGDAVANRWGTVQVQLTVAGGAITDVSVLQYPDGDHKSVAISAHALPTLVEATLATQSAAVDTVSGATYTSEGYRQSLQSALDAAVAIA